MVCFWHTVSDGSYIGCFLLEMLYLVKSLTKKQYFRAYVA